MGGGEVGGPNGAETYVLIANMSDTRAGTAVVSADFDEDTSVDTRTV